ncbi:MAG: AAA family ATPase [Gemmatimonadetes bacterium]|nr:AAA family ATPase [Gemmatimonadota bacterium]
MRSAPLVGRSAELTVLAAALDHAARGAGSAHCLVGEGGIGKSRLVASAIELATTRGMAHVTGRAFAVEQGIPYAPFADAFVPLLRRMPDSMLQVVARGATPELHALFPALGVEGRAGAGAPTQELKPRLLDAFSRVVQRLAARTPLLVVLENIQWADPSSLELLHYLARSVASHPLVLLCTWNDADGTGDTTLATTVHSLVALGTMVVHRLAPLSPIETEELAARQFGVAPDALGPFARELHARTRGNPFFVEETLKALVAQGQLRERDGRWSGFAAGMGELPRTIRDVLKLRLARLSEPARALAAIAAVVGTQAPHALLEALAGLDPEALLTAIDELRHASVLVEFDHDAEIAYEFAHPLLREVLLADVSRARARVLHGRIAEAIERLAGARAADHAEAIAAHVLRAESPELAARARPHLLAAGRAALARSAAREAADLLEAALALAGDDAPADLLDLLARARAKLGRLADAIVLWERARPLLVAAGDDAAVATLARRMAVASARLGRYDDAWRHFDAGLDAAARTGSNALTAQLRLTRSTVRLEVGRAAEAEEDMRAALALAEALGEPRLLARVHQALQALAIWRGPSDEARRHGEAALVHAQAARDPAAEWTTRWAQAMHAGLTGDAEGTARHLAEATALAEALRSPLLQLWTDEIAIEYRSGIGKWDEALVLAERAIADARALGQSALLPRLLVWAAQIHLGRGEHAIAQPMIEEAWRVSGAEQARPGGALNLHVVVPAHAGRASWFLALKDYRAAIEVGERGLEIADRSGFDAWAMHRLLPIIAESSLFLQDFDRAARYGARLRATAQRLSHPLGLAWADACDALRLFLAGDPAGAIVPLERAATALDAIPFVEHAALLRRQLALARIAAGDAAGAIRDLRQVHDQLLLLGRHVSLDGVRETLRSLGARPPARVTPVAGEGALTARELEIARLVAACKTNKEIGTALGISPRTAGTHLANIYGKLGVDSRGALTDLVRSGALDAPGA